MSRSVTSTNHPARPPHARAGPRVRGSRQILWCGSRWAADPRSNTVDPWSASSGPPGRRTFGRGQCRTSIPGTPCVSCVCTAGPGPRKDNVEALRDEPFVGHEVGHSRMYRTLRQVLLLSGHRSCWPARQRSTGDHGGTDTSPRHVRFREVFTAPQPPGPPCPPRSTGGGPTLRRPATGTGAHTVVHRTESPCGSFRIHEQRPGGGGPKRLASPFLQERKALGGSPGFLAPSPVAPPGRAAVEVSHRTPRPAHPWERSGVRRPASPHPSPFSHATRTSYKIASGRRGRFFPCLKVGSPRPTLR